MTRQQEKKVEVTGESKYNKFMAKYAGKHFDLRTSKNVKLLKEQEITSYLIEHCNPQVFLPRVNYLNSVVDRFQHFVKGVPYIFNCMSAKSKVVYIEIANEYYDVLFEHVTQGLLRDYMQPVNGMPQREYIAKKYQLETFTFHLKSGKHNETRDLTTHPNQSNLKSIHIHSFMSDMLLETQGFRRDEFLIHVTQGLIIRTYDNSHYRYSDITELSRAAFCEICNEFYDTYRAN